MLKTKLLDGWSRVIDVELVEKSEFDKLEKKTEELEATIKELSKALELVVKSKKVKSSDLQVKKGV